MVVDELNLDLEGLPTPLAGVARRLHIHGLDDSADCFLYISYLFESYLKSLAGALIAGVRVGSSEDAYRLTHGVLGASGIGTWAAAVASASNAPMASFLPAEYRSLVAWLSQKRRSESDTAFAEVSRDVMALLSPLVSDATTPQTAKQVIDLMVVLRNKTKGHGAPGPDYYSEANPRFLRVVKWLIENGPFMEINWGMVAVRGRKRERVYLELKGLGPRVSARGKDVPQVVEDQLFVKVTEGKAYPLYPVVRTNREATDFLFANGSIRGAKADYINYATGAVKAVDIEQFIEPPAPLPSSETEGSTSLEVHSNVFGNLPPVPDGYVQRVELESELLTRLRDRNHAVITLHGRGGIGKTSLALYAAHTLSSEEGGPFGEIVWFSARDLDLRPSGPKRVSQQHSDLLDLAKSFGALFGEEASIDRFATVLQANGANPAGQGILFILDNFETFSDRIGLHKFLDTHTHLPNKVLLTSRERAFKADFPINVRGMSFEETEQLVVREARSLDIEGILSSENVERIFSYSEGHPYVVRVLLGEMSKVGRFDLPANVMSRRADVVEAVFQRSFERLSNDAKLVFLAVASRNHAVLEIALLVSLGMFGVDVEAGVEECLRLALLDYGETLDAGAFYSAPDLARSFAKKKYRGDPDRLLVDDALGIIGRFGTFPEATLVGLLEDEEARKFVQRIADEATSGRNSLDRERADAVIVALAHTWPEAWLHLARLRERLGMPKQLIDEALRKAGEEFPESPSVWLERARFAESIGEMRTYASALMSASEASAATLDELVGIGESFLRLISGHKADFPVERRRPLLARILARLDAESDSLNAYQIGVLCWLHLQVGNMAIAQQLLERGLAKDPKSMALAKLAKVLPKTPRVSHERHRRTYRGAKR